MAAAERSRSPVRGGSPVPACMFAPEPGSPGGRPRVAAAACPLRAAFDGEDGEALNGEPEIDLTSKEFLKVLAEQNEPYTSKHSLPFLPRLDLSTVADSPLNTFTSSGFPQEDNETERKMELKEKLIKAKLSLS